MVRHDREFIGIPIQLSTSHLGTVIEPVFLLEYFISILMTGIRKWMEIINQYFYARNCLKEG